MGNQNYDEFYYSNVYLVKVFISPIKLILSYALIVPAGNLYSL